MLASGLSGVFAEDGVILGGFPVECFSGLVAGAGTSLGRGWLLATHLGSIFMQERTRHELFTPQMVDAFGLPVPGYLPTTDLDTLCGRLAAALDRAISLPSVDVVETGGAALKSFLRQSTFVTLAVQDAAGRRREFNFKADKDTFGVGPRRAYFDRRWQQEFAALAVIVIDEALGGAPFWSAARSAAARQGLAIVPVVTTLDVARVFRGQETIARVVDGPSEALEAIEAHTVAALDAAGFTEAGALARLYLYQNPWNVRLDDGRFAWQASLRDRQFAAALLERWQPTHTALRQALEARSEPAIDVIAPEAVEKGARGEPID